MKTNGESISLNTHNEINNCLNLQYAKSLHRSDEGNKKVQLSLSSFQETRVGACAREVCVGKNSI